MKEPTTRTVHTALEALTREFHLFRDVTESRLRLMIERFDRDVEPTLGQHGSAILELAADVASVRGVLAEQRGKPNCTEQGDIS